MKSNSSLKWTLAAGVFLALTLGHTAELRMATISRVTNQVDIITPNATPKQAAIGNSIQGNTGVKTGTSSLAELTFPDQTLARLGANTLFSFDAGTRSVELENGTILLQVPKGIGGAKIKTAPVTASITGTTILLEYTRGKHGIVKLIVIEGTVRLSLNGHLGESIVVKSGQEITFSDKSKKLPEVQDVDVSRLMKTSKLINMGPLGNEKQITDELAAQKLLKSKGVLVAINFIGDKHHDPTRMVNQIQNQVQNQRNVTGNPVTHPPSPMPTPARPMPTPPMRPPPTPPPTPPPRPTPGP
ncbi:MAG: FecR family protein [Chthoniobacterales bacterium]